MSKRYDCELETTGYSLRVSVFTENPLQVDALARQKAVERLKQVYGLARSSLDFKLTSVQEKRSL